MTTAPIILWYRRDLRLDDHPALAWAAGQGQPVIPVFLNDEHVARLGPAARMRLGLSVGKLAGSLSARGSRLILRRGPAAWQLAQIVRETGARTIAYSGLTDGPSRGIEGAVDALPGVTTRRFDGHLLHDPDRLHTSSGSYFRVHSAFARALAAAGVAPPVSAPSRWRSPDIWPASESLTEWRLEAGMQRARGVVAPWCHPGEDRAHDRLAHFLDTSLSRYPEARSRLDDRAGSSGLSQHLAWGEMSPRRIWATADGRPGSGKFLSELMWRDFAHHVLWHRPDLETANWWPRWNAFPWADAHPHLRDWQRGRTGYALVDAAMREMWVTGTMHNRARMLVASFLCKHMLVHWRVGQAWFEHALIDWDPASNALNWQWVAGSGPNAAPFFRIINPCLQAAKRDPQFRYRRRWLAEDQALPPGTALSFYDAAPRAWGLSADDPPAAPILDLAGARMRALAANDTMRRTSVAGPGDLPEQDFLGV